MSWLYELLLSLAVVLVLRLFVAVLAAYTVL